MIREKVFVMVTTAVLLPIFTLRRRAHSRETWQRNFHAQHVHKISVLRCFNLKFSSHYVY